MENYLRMRVWPYDYDGNESDLDYVRYFKNEKEIEKARKNNEFWKIEKA